MSGTAIRLIMSNPYESRETTKPFGAALTRPRRKSTGASLAQWADHLTFPQRAQDSSPCGTPKTPRTSAQFVPWRAVLFGSVWI